MSLLNASLPTRPVFPLSEKFVVIIPAAGVGKRMGASLPKQYLTIDGKTVLEHTAHRLLTHPRVKRLVIVINKDDDYIHQTDLAKHDKILLTFGGKERVDSVLAGLQATHADWVMVHDAARPCVRHEDIDVLIRAASECPDGAILATPASDTMKRSQNDLRISGTESREHLWHALTPQMFHRHFLLQAIEQGMKNNVNITDEASAVESVGANPKLVHGHKDNIKITHPEDLALAGFILSQQNK